MKPINLKFLVLILVLCTFSSLNAQYYGYILRLTNNTFTEDDKWNKEPKKYIAYMATVERATEDEVSEALDDLHDKFRDKILPYCAIKYGDPYYTGSMRISKDEDVIIREREEDVSWLKRDNYEIHYEKAPKKSFDSETLNEKTFFNNIDIDGMKVSGYVTVKAKFVFMGYPYIVAEYDDLTIAEIEYKDKTYSQTLNSAGKYLSLPYKAKSKPAMDVVCYIWTPKVKKTKHLKKEHYKIFNYPINGLASITDHYDNDEADQHFKSFDYDDEHDSFFWTRSVFRNPKQDVMGQLNTIEVTSISLALKQELEKKLKTYLYEKDRDFWGNKKDKTKTTKKTKKDDDFWD